MKKDSIPGMYTMWEWSFRLIRNSVWYCKFSCTFHMFTLLEKSKDMYFSLCAHCVFPIRKGKGRKEMYNILLDRFFSDMVNVSQRMPQFCKTRMFFFVVTHVSVLHLCMALLGCHGVQLLTGYIVTTIAYNAA